MKQALEKVLGHQSQIAQTGAHLAAVKQELSDLTQDQSRLSENLKIVPPNSEVHKQFLDKFVKQETQIDNLQKQVRELQATLDKQTAEYESYVKTLNAR